MECPASAFSTAGGRKATSKVSPAGPSVRRAAATPDLVTDNHADAESLYTKLEHVIVPMFYNERERYLNVMQHAIAINGSFFNTQRMVQQYITDAYMR